jgi:hypothetical protein
MRTYAPRAFTYGCRVDPRDAAEQLGIRQGAKGANIQLVDPNDTGAVNCCSSDVL